MSPNPLSGSARYHVFIVPHIPPPTRQQIFATRNTTLGESRS
jgi:hypothetical protein